MPRITQLDVMPKPNGWVTSAAGGVNPASPDEVAAFAKKLDNRDKINRAIRANAKRSQAQMHVDWVASCFDQAKKTDSGWSALCPSHDDQTASLTINEGDNGGVVLHCHAGCSPQHVVDAAGLSMRDLMPGAKVIVGVYDYQDEQGEVLYQVVRFQPKTFRQRRPKPEGGYDWKLGDVRRVLYNLPELLQSDAADWVFVVEGEKDADRLAELDLVATCNVGGAGKWRAEYTEVLRNRHVVVVPDNDSAGWEHAERVCLSLHGVAASVRLLELPGLPEKGDVSDWLAAGGSHEELLRLVTATPLWVPPSTLHPTGHGLRVGPVGLDPTGRAQKRKVSSQDDSDPLGDDPTGDDPEARRAEGALVAVPPFPIEVLPGVLRKFVESVAQALPCPPDFPGVFMLGVLSVFIGRKRIVAPKKSWKEQPAIWLAVVARSGDRKTPAFQAVTEPLRRKQEQLLAEYRQAIDAWNDANKEGPKPVLTQLYTTDSTIEALKDVFVGNPNGIIFLADELSGWARSIGQYKSGQGDDRQHYLSMQSGVTVTCNRKAYPEPIIIPNPFLTIVGGIQPDALGDLIDSSREDGFAARILFAYPDPIPPPKWNEREIDHSIEYAGICETLWKLQPQDQPVTLDAAAKLRFIEWLESHRAEEPPDNLRPTWSKAEGHCLRIALILQLARQACNITKSPHIELPSIEGAIKLIEYFEAHARRVYPRASLATDKDRIARALQFIRKHGGMVTARKLRQYGYAKDPEEAENLLLDLEELGHGTVSKGKQGSIEFQLFP